MRHSCPWHCSGPRVSGQDMPDLVQVLEFWRMSHLSAGHRRRQEPQSRMPRQLRQKPTRSVYPSHLPQGLAQHLPLLLHMPLQAPQVRLAQERDSSLRERLCSATCRHRAGFPLQCMHLQGMHRASVAPTPTKIPVSPLRCMHWSAHLPCAGTAYLPRHPAAVARCDQVPVHCRARRQTWLSQNEPWSAG